MDSGVETGNDSNDSCAQNQMLALPQSKPKHVVQIREPPADIFYHHVSDNRRFNNPFENLELRCEHHNLMVSNNNVVHDFNETTSFKPIGSSSPKASVKLLHQHDCILKMRYPVPRHNFIRKSIMPYGRLFSQDKALRAAVITNNTELLEQLLNTGKASPNKTDTLGRTPLHMAACRGYAEAVKILLSYGANPNLQDRIGNTPLHLAAVTSKTQIVDLLLKAGTNIKSTDHFGNNPLDLAKTKLRVLQTCTDSHVDIIKKEVLNIINLLKSHLNDINVGAEQVEALTEICSRLTLSNSTDQIQDDVKNLLSNLDSLSLAK